MAYLDTASTCPDVFGVMFYGTQISIVRIHTDETALSTASHVFDRQYGRASLTIVTPRPCVNRKVPAWVRNLPLSMLEEAYPDQQALPIAGPVPANRSFAYRRALPELPRPRRMRRVRRPRWSRQERAMP